MISVRSGFAALAAATFAVALSAVLAPGAGAASLGSAASASAQLRAVSCTSATQCFAVGSVAPGGPGTNIQPLIESFNGTTWSISAAKPATASSALFGISCATATNCMAVGNQDGGSLANTAPLAERWNGTAWSIVPVPAPRQAMVSELTSVSCATGSSCLAVGEYNFDKAAGMAGFAEHWNGTAWTEMPIKYPTHSVTFMQGVSCRSASDCAAAGFSGDRSAQTGFGPTLAEHFNGRAWAIEASPNATKEFENVLAGVSCAPGAGCMAVGNFFVSTPQATFPRSLAEQFNGTAWSRVTVPLLPGASSQSLASVSCPAANECAAVGAAFTGTSQVPEAASWNGTKWSAIIAPSPGPKALLAGVSCPGAAVCVGVGQSTDSSGTAHTLAEVRTGGTWQIVTTPSP